ncbi:UvrD-helicase domain-containing protein [Microbispora sp. ATCC PTA-5024]|uniref:UvrD-helicase domain-containing protein n=1 Tax=Microbispora sp. ATCC PTA-5024 TaxID=316330 RepID=UPI0003DD8627|nr:UvrD-helicase domain-containing protein [Microbispora sp. ATCC PTA-5024]ETK31138.1 DNA helicase UvrD [Microbispora sp. ATCC PTA-5024]
MPRLAIAPEFTRDLGALSRPVRRDVVVAVRRFLRNSPSAPHPERVRNSRDHRVATLRLADRHRGVVVRQNDVYWLLTVLPDAEAWSYAQRHRFGVNTAIGVVECWDAEALERIEPALYRAAESSDRRLFDRFCDTELLHLGIDARLLPLLRMMTSESHLTAVEPLLPESQYAPLAALARGGSLAAAWRELDACRAFPLDEVDPEDLAEALRRSPGQAAFAEGQHELDRILTTPHWCTFLHPPQHTYANWPRYDRPVLVTGGAGTGKTIVALHRAAGLARAAGGPVLLVTFSQGLATELSARLDMIVNDEVVRKRVEVGNVDRIAHRIVAEAEGRAPALVGAAELAELWQEAAIGRFGTAFLLREWEQVILAQNLRTFDEYRDASRPGRSVELDADARLVVWEAVQHVVGRLRETGRRTLLQLASEAADLLGRSVGDLLGEEAPGSRPYRHIVVDEAQDLHPAQWRLLRAAVPVAANDLFVVGDPHQRMFDTRVALADVGIPARRFHLRISYRLPQEILTWGVRLRGGGPADGLVPGNAEMYGYRAVGHGPRPMVREYVTPEAELAGLVSHVAEWVEDGVPTAEIAVTARTADLVKTARTALREAGIMVKVTPLHGMKGLEFRRVAVIGVADGIVPAPDALTPATEDPTARAHDLQRERGLLYVACTRAGELLYVSYSGRASPFLPS